MLTPKRGALLKRLERFRMVPGHEPDLSKMTDDELEQRAELFENLFKLAYKEDDNDRAADH